VAVAAEQCHAHGGVAQAVEQQAEQFPPPPGEPVGVVQDHDQPAAGGDVAREHGKRPRDLGEPYLLHLVWLGSGGRVRPGRDEVEQRAALSEGEQCRPALARADVPARRRP
jgi:hypothetical protein